MEYLYTPENWTIKETCETWTVKKEFEKV